MDILKKFNKLIGKNESSAVLEEKPYNQEAMMTYFSPTQEKHRTVHNIISSRYLATYRTLSSEIQFVIDIVEALNDYNKQNKMQ